MLWPVNKKGHSLVGGSAGRQKAPLRGLQVVSVTILGTFRHLTVQESTFDHSP